MKFPVPESAAFFRGRHISVWINSFLKTSLVLFLLFSMAVLSSGQKKGELYFGLGFPELANIGVRYPVFHQIRAGLSIGGLPRSAFNFGDWDNLVSLSGDLYFHFGRTTNFSDKRLFYLNIGVNFLQEKPYQWDVNWWNTYLRTGGEIYSSRNLGVNIDGGFIFNLNPEKNWAQMDRILPSFGVDVFYRF